MRVPSWHLGEELFLQESIINFIPLCRAEKFSFPALPKANLYSDSALPSFFQNTIKRQGGEMDRHRVHVHYLEKQSCVSVNNDCFWKKNNLYIVFISFDELSDSPQHMSGKTEWSDGQAEDWLCN